MNFLKNFFRHDKIVIGLCGIRRQPDCVKILVPHVYKKASVQNVQNNYILF